MSNSPSLRHEHEQQAPPQAERRNLHQPGDRVENFNVRSTVNPSFRFDSMGGRWIVLGLIGKATLPGMAARVAAAMQAADVFDDDHASLFVITHDPSDETEGRLRDMVPGRRIFWDDTCAVARQLGALPVEAPADGQTAYAPFWLVLDPCFHVHRLIPFRADGGDVAEMLDWMRKTPPPERYLGFAVPAPVLILPKVFEPEFCDHLIGLYEAHGGIVSGFMRDKGGKTVAVHDKSFKVRSDYTLSDPDDIAAVQARILRRVVPQIERVHFFKVTRMERYMVGCYDAEEGGHFRPHRDNTTLGTAHRRFAVSINLTDDFDGGEVSFPEYGPKGFKGPKGSAVIFSCALLHAVSPVTRGRRYAFLPFLYDDAAARIREANAAKVPNAAGYRA